MRASSHRGIQGLLFFLFFFFLITQPISLACFLYLPHETRVESTDSARDRLDLHKACLLNSCLIIMTNSFPQRSVSY